MSGELSNGEVTWKPTSAQMLLLRACLDENEQHAKAALHQWCHAVKGSRHDPASQRLLPILWRRWGSHGTLRAQLPLAAGKAWFQSWERGHRQLRIMNQLSLVFGELNIPTLLIKGMPLALQAYGDLGQRPMSDIDLAVPFQDAPRSIIALSNLGWQPQPTPLKAAAFDPNRDTTPPWLHQPRPLNEFDTGYRCVRHAHAFRHADGHELDLHWFLLQEQCEPGTDDAIWATSVPLRGVNRSSQSDVSPLLLCPSPAHHLLLLLAHAARWDPLPSIRWIADAVMLIRTSAQLDWNCFLIEAKRRQLTLPAQELLSWLEQNLKPGIPMEVITDLRAVAVSRHEQMKYNLSTRQPTWRNGVEELRYLHQRFKQIRHRYADDYSSISFSRFVCRVIGAPSHRALLNYAGHELLRRSRDFADPIHQQ
jgi:hypothetical protein